MKVRDIFAEKEAAGFLLSKVDGPYITRYINHITSHPSHEKYHSPLSQTYMLRTTQLVDRERMTVEHLHQQKPCSGSKHTQHAKAVMTTTTQQKGRLVAKQIESLQQML